MSEENFNAEGDATVEQNVGTSQSDLVSSEAPKSTGSESSGSPDQAPEGSVVRPDQPSMQAGNQKRHLRKTRVGEVVSNKMDKTVVVAVIRRVAHPKFGKIIKRTKKLYAHDAENKCAIGDLVRIEETRPLSRLKRWQLVEILKH